VKVIIVGAGMAGLIAAYRLKGNPDAEITILEKADRPGGRVGTLEIADGFIVDHSAQFLADNYHRTFQLLQELGIREELEAVDDEHFMCLLRNGQILAFPAGILGFLRTSALSVREKLDVARLVIMALIGGREEAFVRPSALMKFDGIGLSDYCRERFARSTLDDVLHPMIAMTMGTPEDVSLLLAVSMLSVVDEKHFVLRHGNGTLPKRLAQLCPPIRTETPVKRIAIDGERVRGVELENGEGNLEADVVVCATNAHEAAEILPDLDEAQRGVLRETPYSCCLQVLLATEEPQLQCWGLGIPRSTDTFLTYITEETYKSKHRAPEGRGLTQVFIIGDAARNRMSLKDDEIAAQVHAEVRMLLPNFPERILCHGVIRRQEAMALSAPGYQKKLVGLNQSLERIRGLYVIGDYQTFPTIEGAVYVGEEAAARILKEHLS
jgi:protoporphyrinogen oxidase